MAFWKEFKEFAVKGNVVDLAIGVIIGGAFGKIVTSLVNDIIMPVVSRITSFLNFDGLQKIFIVLNPDGVVYKTAAAAKEANKIVMDVGSFITNIVDFLIIALSIFIIIKQINRLKPKPAPAPVTTKECPYCKSKIHIEATRCPNCTSELNGQ